MRTTQEIIDLIHAKIAFHKTWCCAKDKDYCGRVLLLQELLAEILEGTK